MLNVDDWAVPADDLTQAQRAAVEHFKGPLLVLAGPGSGKTRVITRRIARLIERGVRPWEILAITFTNKAAREMADRVQTLLPGSKVWVSTFHRFCARLLRERGGAIGLQSNYSIFDTGDQLTLLRQVLHELDLDSAHFPPAKLAHRISQAKNELLTPEQYQSRYGEGIGTHLEAVVSKVYPVYQRQLRDANAVDFDDLLMHVAGLLADNQELREELDQRYRFILVDEYQDTNRAQYQIVAALSQIEPNLCATGDPDQSIYGWRGAQIANILRFENDYPDVTLIRLEENFRSTPEILQTADALISHNVHRKKKRLQAVHAAGEPVELRLFSDGQAEATAIVNEIAAQVEAGERQWKDFAIFYRVNSLSRTLETSLSLQKVPYQIAGGTAFYERKEIKDLLAYLRLIHNPRDNAAFQRIVNVPVRGIGKTSLEKLVAWADANGLGLLDAARQASAVPGMSKKAAVQLRSFAAMIDEFAEFSGLERSQESFDNDDLEDATKPAVDSPPGDVESLLRFVIQRTGYARQFDDESDEDDVQRLSNIHELVSAARLYDGREADAEQESALGGFLETASLVQDADSLDESTGAVSLMTLHSAKGLEFPVVYLIAVEQNIIPHERSLGAHDPQQVEEERRLLFVGITRAKEKLVLTHTVRRDVRGRSLTTIPSDFLTELIVERRDHTGINDFQFGSEFDSNESNSDAEFAADAIEEDEGISIGDVEESDAFSQPGDRGRNQARGKSEARRGSPPAGWRLTTAAALEAGAKKTVDLPFGFAIGMQVRHPRYGLGTVVDVSGMSLRRTVTVEFDVGNRKESFVASKCPLQPVGLR